MRTIDDVRRRLRIGLAVALFLVVMFLAGAAIPYACHTHDVPDETLERLEQQLRDAAARQGRDTEEIEALVRELHDHYGGGGR